MGRRQRGSPVPVAPVLGGQPLGAPQPGPGLEQGMPMDAGGGGVPFGAGAPPAATRKPHKASKHSTKKGGKPPFGKK